MIFALPCGYKTSLCIILAALFFTQPGNTVAYAAPQVSDSGVISTIPTAKPGTRVTRNYVKPGQGTAKMTIATRSLTQKDEHSTVMVNYPQVGNSKIDTELDFWAGKTIGTFAAGVKNLSMNNQNRRCSMLVDYELSESSGNIFSIVFRITTETGDAHPDYGMVTFSYDLFDGRKLGLQDLFADTNGLLGFLSAYSYDILTAELSSSLETRIKNGTAPNLLNFSFFALAADGLIVYFPPNQVADYSSGEQKVRVPINKLTPFKPRANLWPAAKSNFKSESLQKSIFFRQITQNSRQ